MKKQIVKILAGVVCLACNAALRAQAADEDYVENSEFTKTVTIAFDGTSAIVVNGAGTGLTYTQNGANIVITSAVEGVEYILSGTATGGSVKFNGNDQFKLTLNGVSLTSTNNKASSATAHSPSMAAQST
jgi:hypothetical protein